DILLDRFIAGWGSHCPLGWKNERVRVCGGGASPGNPGHGAGVLPVCVGWEETARTSSSSTGWTIISPGKYVRLPIMAIPRPVWVCHRICEPKPGYPPE